MIQILQHTMKGPIPAWYNEIKSKITNIDSYILQDTWANLPWEKQYNQFISPLETQDRRFKNWYIWHEPSNSDQINWGKGKENNKSSDISLVHHIPSIDPFTDNTILKKCNGCTLNSQKKQNKNFSTDCVIHLDGNMQIYTCNLLNEANRLRMAKEPKIPCNKKILENCIRENIQQENQNKQLLDLPQVVVQDWGIQIIEDHVPPSIYRDSLSQTYINNTYRNTTTQSQEIEFFTDGSLIKTKDHETLMGAAWIQTKGPNPGTNMSAGIINWPSSFKAELTAIFLAILTVPFYSTVTIQTDSLSVIKKYEKLSNICPKKTHRKWLKEKNWSLWIRLIETIQKKNLQIKFVKVKAHSNNIFNNQVDQLAKRAVNEPPIFWKDLNSSVLTTTPMWNGIIIDIGIRDFLKEINKRKSIINWTEQNRIRKAWKQEIVDQDAFNWSTVWAHSKVGKVYTTSYKQLKERSFRINLMHNELPTLQIMATRRPDLYTDHTECPTCKKEPETLLHLLSCKERKENWEEIWEKSTAKPLEHIMKEVQNTKKLSKMIKKTDTTKTRIILQEILQDLKEEIVESPESKRNFAIGLTKRDTWKKFQPLIKDGVVTRSTIQRNINEISRRFTKQIRKLIWKPRCTLLIQSDKKRGITQKRKFHKPPKITSSLRTTVKQNDEEDNRNSDPPDKEEKSRNFRDIITGWIKEGKKWLGV